MKGKSMDSNAAIASFDCPPATFVESAVLGSLHSCHALCLGLHQLFSCRTGFIFEENDEVTMVTIVPVRITHKEIG